MKCPNKNLPEWKALEKAQPDLAHYLWNKHDGNLPADLLESIMSEEVIDPKTGEATLKALPKEASVENMGELQNEYIDIHWKVLTHPDVLSKVLSPLDKKGKYSIEGEADLIHGIRTKDKALSSPLSRGYQQRTFLENRAGKVGVGVTSLSSTFNAQIQDMNLMSGVMFGGSFTPRGIEFEGINMHILSGVGTNPNGSKADVIADMQNAAVDNANEQRLNKVNLNSHTFAAAGALAQLEDSEGNNLDVQYITRLLAQQSIMDFVNEAESLDDSTVEDFVIDKKEEAYKRVLEKYTNMLSSETDLKLSPELMLQMIKEEGNPSDIWAALQIKALDTFMKADEIGTDLVTLQGAINADSKGAGKDMLGVADKVAKIKGINSLSIVGTEPLMNPETEVGKATELGPILADTLFGSLFPYNSTTAITLQEALKNITGKAKTSLDNQALLFKHFNGFLYSTPGLFTDEDIKVTKALLLVDSKDNESLATRVDKALATWGADNYFLQIVTTKHPNKLGGFSTIEYKASADAQSDEQKATKSIVDLLNSNDPIQAKLGADLVTYSYITATSQHATNFMKFIPTAYLNVKNVGEKLSQYKWELDNSVSGFMRQYLQHNPSLAPQAPKEITGASTFSLPAISDDLSNELASLLIMVRTTRGTVEEYPQFLHRRDTTANMNMLYEKSLNEDGSVTYNRIDTLGQDRIIEYNKGEVRATSLVQENKAPNAKVPMTNLPTASTKGSTPNPVANTNMLGSYGLKDGSDKAEVIESFDVIAENSENRSHKALAKILSMSQDNLPDFTFNIDNTGSTGKFTQRLNSKNEIERKVSLNLLKIDNTHDFEKTLLHESIHVYTSNLMVTDSKNLTRSQRRAVKSIKALKNAVISSLTLEEKAEFDIFNAKYIKYREANESGDFKTRDNIDFGAVNASKYYGLVNDKEFVTMAMTDSGFQKRLNDVKFTGDRTMFVRFQEIIAELLKGMQEALGVEVVSGSVLEQAVNDITDLMASKEDMMEGVSEDYSLDATQYSSSIPVGLNRKFRSEFGLLNSSGLPRKDMSFERASRKVRLLNKPGSKFNQLYKGKYKAETTKIKGEKGDSRIYDQVRIVERAPSSTNTNNISDFSIDSDTGVSPSIKALVSRLKTRVTAHRYSMNNTSGDTAVYQDKIDRLENQITRLNRENNLKSLKAVADANLTWVANTLDKTTLSPSEVNEAYNSLSVWGNLSDLFETEYDQGGPFKVAVNEISIRSTELSSKLSKVQKNLIQELGKGKVSRPITNANMESMADISGPSAYLLDVSNIDNPFVNLISKTLSTAIKDTNYDFNQESKNSNNVIEKFKETEEFKKSGYTPFLQLNPKGEWTGGLVVEYSHALVEERARRKAILNASKKTSNDFKKYFKWVKANETMVDSKVLFTEAGVLQETPKAKAHIKSLEKEFGEAKAKRMVDKAQSLFMDFLMEKEAIKVEYSNNLLDPDYNQKDFDADVQTWVIRNSPKSYIGTQEGSSFNTEAKGSRFVVTEPKKVFANGKETGWYDNNFQKIIDNPVLSEFYDFYTTKLNKMISNLPAHESDSLGSTFLPDIKRSLLESYSQEGAGNALSGLSSALIDSISSDIDSKVSQDRDMHTGKAIQRIGISFNKGNIEVGDRSKDLGKILDAFTMTSLNYKHKAKTEDFVLIMQRVLHEAQEQKLNSQDGNATDTDGALHLEKDGLSNVKKVVDHAIKASLYGQKREKGKAFARVSAKGYKATIRANELSSEIKKLNKLASVGEITDEEHTEQVVPLQEELTKLGARDITNADIADATMQITQLKGMAYNIFASANNITLGLLSNLTQAAGGEDFSIRQLLRAYRIMLNSTGKSLGKANKTSLKVSALMEKFDILFEVDEAAYNGNKKAKKSGVSSLLAPMELQRRAEYFVQGQLMVAKMLNMTATTLDGTETSLFEAFDENGDWRADVYGENQGWDGDINTDGDLKDFRDLQAHLIELNKVVHGNYDPASFPLAKRYIIGRFALQFKSWFAESIKRRYGGQNYNEALKRDTKGFYRSVWENKMAFLKMGLMQKDGLSTLSEIDQANLKKGMVELLSLTSFTIMGLMLQHLADDDDEPNPQLNMLLNLTYRMESDLSFYLSPSSFNRLLSNPVPAIKVYLDAGSAINKVADYMLQDETDGRKKVDGMDVLSSVGKVFPVFNQIGKIQMQGDKVISNN